MGHVQVPANKEKDAPRPNLMPGSQCLPKHQEPGYASPARAVRGTRCLTGTLSGPLTRGRYSPARSLATSRQRDSLDCLGPANPPVDPAISKEYNKAFCCPWLVEYLNVDTRATTEADNVAEFEVPEKNRGSQMRYCWHCRAVNDRVAVEEVLITHTGEDRLKEVGLLLSLPQFDSGCALHKPRCIPVIWRLQRAHDIEGSVDGEQVARSVRNFARYARTYVTEKPLRLSVPAAAHIQGFLQY